MRLSSVEQIENYLLDMGGRAPDKSPLTAAATKKCMEHIDVADPELAQGIRASLQHQAILHQLGRKYIGSRTSAAQSNNALKLLVDRLTEIEDVFHGINSFQKNDVSGWFQKLQNTNISPAISLFAFQIKLDSLREAATRSMSSPKRGNRSDILLESTVGGLMFFMLKIIQPVRPKAEGDRRNGTHFTLRRQSNVIEHFFSSVEPDYEKPLNSQYINYLVRKISRAHPGDEIEFYAHVLELKAPRNPHPNSSPTV